ncbi:MAG: hypothetical protein ACM3U2_15480 [Deltaproteobacteria bacterium]|jgi:hypothetical protein
MNQPSPLEPPRISRAEIGVLAFNLAYLAIALIASFRLQNREFLFYFVVMCVLLAAVAALHLRLRLPIAALWGLSLWGLAHMAGGLMPIPESWRRHGETHVLYNLWLIPQWLKYDQLVHACGFGLVTWICWLGLQKAFALHGVAIRPTLGLLTLCVAGGTGFGAANEVVEFIATLTLPSTNVGGYDNTGWDLVSNLVGCLLAAVVIRLREGRPFPDDRRA